MPNEEKSFMRKFGEYSQLAFLLPAHIVAGLIVGYLLDKWLGTTWLYMLFLLIGIAGGLLQTIRFVQRDKS